MNPPVQRPNRPARGSLNLTRTSLAVLIGSLLMAAPLQHEAFAATKKSSKAAAVATAAASADGTTTAVGTQAKTYSISMKDLGILSAIQLRGVEGSASVPFNIRSDEVVVAAKLRMNYSYSPALIERLSHIKIFINGESVAVVPVPKDESGTRLTREIVLPVKTLADYNKLTFQLIGHYTLDCEDPAHSSLWAHVSTDTTLELTALPTALANELALLPRPFFDAKDNNPLVLPMVIPNKGEPGVLEAAGAISSWFGALADYRGARFPVSDSQLPAKGNAVVVLMGGNKIAGLDVPNPAGASLTVMPNPNDQFGKLLVVSGRDSAQVKLAAAALVTGSQALSGATANINTVSEIKPRKPYDAPRWTPSDRPVRFGEIVDERDLTVTGYYPDLIRINLKVPPDLFTLGNKEVPIDLKYRYTQPPRLDKSTLNVNVNKEFLRMMPLRSVKHESPNTWSQFIDWVTPNAFKFAMPDREKFGIPLHKVHHKTQLQFHYYHDIVKEGACMDVILDNVRGTIDADSTIDLSAFPHFKAMPDLAAFVNAGYPFSRMADLSETGVVLPDAPDASDLQTYLTVMGQIGASTGHPVTGVTVVGSQQVDAVSGKDLLLIGNPKNQPLLGSWSSAMPVAIDNSARRFRFSDLTYRLFNGWRTSDQGQDLPTRNQVIFTSNSSDAAIVGFESPLKSGRSVVAIASNQSGGLEQAIDAMQTPALVTQIQGGLAVIRGKQVSSLTAADEYHVGSMNPLVWVYWKLSKQPLLLALFGVLAAAFAAGVIYVILKARAKSRLK